MPRQFLAPRTMGRSILPIAILALASLLLPAGVSAQVIHACYVPNSGTMYRIKATDPAETCKTPQHIQFSWNIQGPPGEDGADGVDGEDGEDGADGTDGQDGVSGYQVVQATTALAVSGLSSGSVMCPAGKVVLGGGYSFPSGLGFRSATSSAPASGGGGLSGWLVHVMTQALQEDVPGDLIVFAICASVPEAP